ncbi:WAT1-related protein [Hibiscus syriacus]|uniref:WAT1-related protein n=1 Tax=Hibiscus syriacus TaxID=106335 RepID=A0A6A2XR28_HIBSY|nr:WAT1-related protein At4g08300-like [Hibiscus syriacus]KAE8656324.1 WAT1-related protein [Hibiscus syriacus]
MGEQSSCIATLFKVLNKVKPYLAIVSLQFGFAGMYILSTISLKHGMSNFILATYRHVVATIVIVPFAIVLERKIRPKMTLPIFLRIVVLGFLEPVLDQNLYYMGMKLTNATYSSAFVNMLPAVTFILAVIFRLEKVNLKKIRSVAKIVGTLITVFGAMVMTLYKGPIINFIKSGGGAHHATAGQSADQNWVFGTIVLLGSIFGWSSFFILQSFTLKKYPAELSLTAWICFMGMVQDGLLSLIMVRDFSAWKIGLDARLLAASYSGVVCSGIAYYVQGIVIRERGPVFVTSFSPLCMIITAALGAFILSEKVHLGSILGAIIIVSGLYTVVWGKAKDGKQSETDEKNNGLQELPITDNGRPMEAIDGTAKAIEIPVSSTIFSTRGT